MLKKSYFILFLMPFFCFSQSHRFIYLYKFVADSTKTDSIQFEETRLEVFGEHSEFVSNVNAKRDSALAIATKNNQSPETVKLSKGLINNKVYKSKKLSYSIEYIGIQPFKVIQKSNLNWRLTKETKKIQNYICQKALANYGGREWEAWFTQEIPIQDGPYIFANLPGLIVQINDLKNQHSFFLIGNNKAVDSRTNFADKRFFIPVQVSQKQFNKIWNNFNKNPIGATEQFMNMNPGLLSGQSFDGNGNEIDLNPKKREEQRYAQKQLLQYNNYIDLKLYKVN